MGGSGGRQQTGSGGQPHLPLPLLRPCLSKGTQMKFVFEWEKSEERGPLSLWTPMSLQQRLEEDHVSGLRHWSLAFRPSMDRSSSLWCVRWLTHIGKLSCSQMTMETNLWATLCGNFQRSFTSVGRSALNVRGTVLWVTKKQKLRTTRALFSPSLLPSWLWCDQPPHPRTAVPFPL